MLDDPRQRKRAMYTGAAIGVGAAGYALNKRFNVISRILHAADPIKTEFKNWRHAKRAYGTDIMVHPRAAEFRMRDLRKEPHGYPIQRVDPRGPVQSRETGTAPGNRFKPDSLEVELHGRPLPKPKSQGGNDLDARMRKLLDWYEKGIKAQRWHGPDLRHHGDPMQMAVPGLGTRLYPKQYPRSAVSAEQERAGIAAHTRQLRKRLWDKIRTKGSGVSPAERMNDGDPRAPNLMNVKQRKAWFKKLRERKGKPFTPDDLPYL